MVPLCSGDRWRSLGHYNKYLHTKIFIFCSLIIVILRSKAAVCCCCPPLGGWTPLFMCWKWRPGQTAAPWLLTPRPYHSDVQLQWCVVPGVPGGSCVTWTPWFYWVTLGSAGLWPVRAPGNPPWHIAANDSGSSFSVSSAPCRMWRVPLAPGCSGVCWTVKWRGDMKAVRQEE